MSQTKRVLEDFLLLEGADGDELMRFIDRSEMFKHVKKVLNTHYNDVTVGVDLEWVKGWLALWPTRSDAPHLEYSPRTSAPETLARMNRLLKTIKKRIPEFKDMTQREIQDAVMEATAVYLDQCKQRNWAYTKKALKFILDTDGSMLEQYLSPTESAAAKKKSAYDYMI
jgi:hypothetical protein